MKRRAALEGAHAVYKRTCSGVKPDTEPQLGGDRRGIRHESIFDCHTTGHSTWNGGGSLGVLTVNEDGDPRIGRQSRGPL